MKKIISSLVASGMLIATVAPSYASASSITPLNELSVESSVLTEGITVDGNYIPSGSLAVSVNISNNTGFTSFSTKVDLGSAYDVLLDNDNKPVVSVGSVIEDSLYSCSEKDNFLAFVTSSAVEADDNGEIFTFYVNKDENSNDASIALLDIANTTPISIGENASIMSGALGYYISGDFNDDDIIDGRDASACLSGLNKTGQSELPYSIAQLMPTYYFPNIYTIESAYIWSDKRNMTITNTAQVILNYYTATSVGNLYPHTDGLLIGYAFPI